jgi:hypothetical protein
LQTAERYVLNVVFSAGTASGGANIDVNQWNMFLGINGNGTTSPETEFLANQPFDLLIDLHNTPFSYVTDQPMQTTTLPNGDVVYMADQNYGVSSIASGSQTNIAGYFLITGTDAANLNAFLNSNPEIILAPYNFSSGGGRIL